jgi:hypothetical protein
MKLEIGADRFDVECHRATCLQLFPKISGVCNAVFFRLVPGKRREQRLAHSRLHPDQQSEQLISRGRLSAR